MRSALIGLVFLASMPAWGETTWRGTATAEQRYFTREALHPDQRNGYTSLMVQPELHTDWDQGRQSLTVTPFYRWDQHDKQRSHGDLWETVSKRVLACTRCSGGLPNHSISSM